jgi:anti-sigma28 factor (negative regulator of flagellin synthesis)
MFLNNDRSSYAEPSNIPASLAMLLPLSAYGKGASQAAQADFSEKALVIAVAAVAVDAASDTRDDLVARLKPQILSGDYRVNSNAVASQMIARA